MIAQTIDSEPQCMVQREVWSSDIVMGAICADHSWGQTVGMGPEGGIRAEHLHRVCRAAFRGECRMAVALDKFRRRARIAASNSVAFAFTPTFAFAI